MNIKYMHKGLALILSLCLIITLLSLITTETTGATTIPKPSVPQFTVKFIDTSYETSPTPTIDPYTGKTVIPKSVHVEARAIEIRIKNEPFTSFTIQDNSSNTWNIDYFYNIRWKGHFEQEWTEVSYPSNGYLRRNSGSESVFSIIGGEYSSSEGLKLYIHGWQSSYTVGAQIDVQVEAMIGYVHRVFENGGFPYVFTGETSGWSDTQTLTITDTAPSTVTVDQSGSPQYPTQTPLQPNVGTSMLFGLDWVGVAVVVLLGVVVVLLVFVVFYLRKRR